MNKKKIALYMNILIVILELVGFVIAFGNHGFLIFCFYTQLSNMILCFASAYYVIKRVCKKNLTRKEEKNISTMKYLATCFVTVTFLVVLFVLMPMMKPYGTKEMIHILIGEANLYHHTLCPILALISFFLFETGKIEMRENLIAVIPTLLYAIVTTILNICKVIRGPYPFLYVYEQPIYMSVFWFVSIVGSGFLIALAIRKIKWSLEKNKKDK